MPLLQQWYEAERHSFAYLVCGCLYDRRTFPVDLEDSYTGGLYDGIPIQVIEAGDVLGWSWLFPPYSWRFDARTLEPVKAIFFYGTRLREHCEADHDLGYELMKRMAAVVIQRLQATREQLLQARST